ncbi:restriction endonuclease subunit S [Serratia plymuthica]|nr:hypothetical protein ADP72_05265 [Serratia plymuthica]QPS89904.1 hypothetical protein I6G46_12480 [Serratia plymuthica]QQT84682.1 hypothetical protein I6I95_02345 [Serratia plymuthica]UJE01885.1 restriction endonuclease subunit S [Serratia plymuthica]
MPDMVIKYHRKPLTIAQQFQALKTSGPNERLTITNKDRTLLWEGWLQPSLFSRRYKVVVRYTLGKLPVCVVTEPDLFALAETTAIPHLYPKDKHIPGAKLCLFLPCSQADDKLSEWRSQQKISETLIPWASLWLFYFEQWLLTGLWEGGGKHPTASGVKNEH